MANDKTQEKMDGELASAEAKRTAARRRFLKQGAAAGSGILVVTLHHQRAIAGKSKQIMTSSAATCTSLGGTSKGTKKVVDSLSGGQKVTRTVCQV